MVFIANSIRRGRPPSYTLLRGKLGCHGHIEEHCAQLCLHGQFRRLPHQEDVKCDNQGSWRNNGINNRTYEMNEDGYPELLDEEEASREATDTYTLRRVYYKNMLLT